MLVEKLTVSMWVMLFVVVGSGVDYIRVRRLDRQVLCYFAISGLAAGSVFQFVGVRWGDGPGLLTALLAAAALACVSRKFILEHIVCTDRETETERSEKWKQEFEALKQELNQEE